MNILIVKLSSLGDVVHTLPAVVDIRAHFPSAQIHWVVERSFAPLLNVCPSVDRVIGCDIRAWRKSWWTHKSRQAYKAFKQDLQRTEYDFVIDLQGLSKSAWVSLLARLSLSGKRYALGNQTDGAAYEFLARWVADEAIVVKKQVHAVERSRLVCAQALGYAVDNALIDSLNTVSNDLSPNTLDAATLENEHLNLNAQLLRMPAIKVTPAPEVLPNTVAFITASSREDKTWPLSFWSELGEALIERGFNIAFPQGSPTELEQVRAISHTLLGSKVWIQMGLDTLSAHLSACVGVIGVDSGLSHIAEVLDLPLVQIYNFDTHWRTGPSRLSFQSSVFAQPTPSVKEVLTAWDACWNAHLQRSLPPAQSEQIEQIEQIKKINHSDSQILPLSDQLEARPLNANSLENEKVSGDALLSNTDTNEISKAKVNEAGEKINKTPKPKRVQSKAPSPQLGLFD